MTLASPASEGNGDTPETVHVAADAAVEEKVVFAEGSSDHSSEENIPGLEQFASAPAVVSHGPAQHGTDPTAITPPPLAPPPPVASVPPVGSVPPTAPPSPAPRPPAVEGPETGEPVPSDMILFPRRTFYVQAVLFLVVAGVAFGMGYFIGRGDVKEERVQQELKQRAPQMVSVEGVLSYHPDPSRRAPDDGAVVIMLPAGKYPEKRFPIKGLGPGDSKSSEPQDTIAAIKALGGDYVRADSQGQFSLTLPDRGKYRVLVISRHAERPKDHRIEEPDLMELDRYFDQTERLIARSQYRSTVEETTDRVHHIEKDFGVNEQK